MTREQWKDLLEGIGFAAIIASLIFVGIETHNSTKQAELNTRALEIAAYQDLIDNISELNTLVIEDPDVAKFMYRIFTTDEPFTDEEQFVFTRAMFLRFRHGDMAYFQFERGAIDEERLRSVLRPINMGEPKVQEFWARYKGNFVKPYRDYIDGVIEEINANDLRD